jgi:lipoyl(octanoyl) transferase
MKFRFIDTGFNNAYMNMAIDEALLNSKLPVLRFYQWKPAGLSLGYFQRLKEINIDFCKKNNIDIVRRLTGGNAVLHEHELTYSFIISEKRMPISIIESYKKISLGLLKGLKSLGLNGVMNEDVKKSEKSSVCFNDPSWYEILVNGKKIVGSAQKRVNGKILQHGAILTDINVEKYSNCFNNCNDDIINNLKKRMTSINGELKNKISYEILKSSIKKGFQEALNIEFFDDELTGSEKESAQELFDLKYSKDKWNFRI